MSIVLWPALVGAAMGGRGKDGRGKAELGPLLLLTIWKRPNLYLVYVTVEFRGCSFLGNSSRSVITQSKSSGYISIGLMVMMTPLNHQY